MNRNSQLRPAQRRRFACKLAAYSASCAVFAAADASAAIVYTDLGSTGITVENGVFDLDLNDDGLNEFSIHHIYRNLDATNRNGYFNDVSIHAERRSTTLNGILGFSSFPAVARNLAAGVEIQSQLFHAGSNSLPYSQANQPQLIAALRYDYSSHFCDYEGCSDRHVHKGEFGRGFLGLQFGDIGGDLRYGWAEVAVLESGFQVFRYAYESRPEAAIIAGAVPEPPSLVLLAAGAAGLIALRSRRTRQRMA